MGPRATDYFWQCCHCHGPLISIANNDHCSDCHRRKCRDCHIEAVKIKDTYKSRRRVRGEAQAQSKVKRKGPRRKCPESVPSAPYEAVHPEVREVQAQSHSKQSDLRCEFPELFSATPYEANDLLVCQALSIPPGSTQGPSTLPLSSACINSKRSVEQRSPAESHCVDSPIKCPDLSGPPAGDSPAPIPDISLFVATDFEVSTLHNALFDHSHSCNVDATAAESPIPTGHPSQLGSLSHLPLYSSTVGACGECWFDGLVDQGDSAGDAQEATPSSSGSTPGDGPGDQPSGGSKRKRESNNKDESRDAKTVETSISDNRSTADQSKSRLACQFYKMNPRQHFGCIRKSYDTIGHLNQHLRKDHKLGPNDCKSCWALFASEADLIHHVCHPTGGKPADQFGRIPRLEGPYSQWYWMWGKLFPNSQKPETPYYTDGPDDLMPVYHQLINVAVALYPALSRVDLMAALQQLSSTPAYILNARQLLTSTTAISENEIRASPAAFQTFPEKVNTTSYPQLPAIPMNRSDVGISSSILPDREKLLFLNQPPTKGIEEKVEEFHAPSIPTYGINTTNNVETSANYDSGPKFVPTLQEEINISTCNPQQVFTDGPSDGEFYQHGTFDEETMPHDLNRSALNPQHLTTGNSSNATSHEQWDYAEGMAADEHLGLVMHTESIGNFQHHTRKEMNIEEPGDSDSEDPP